MTHRLGNHVEPLTPRGDMLEEYPPLELAIGLYLIHRRVGVYEPTAQVVLLQLLRIVNVVAVTILGVT